MKKLFFSACLCILSLSVFAQEYKEPDRDTLKVTKVMYQMMELSSEEWPCTEIYRNRFGFIFMDQQLDVIERKEYASAVFYKLNLYNTSEHYELWSYKMSEDVLRLKLGDFQFYCHCENSMPDLQYIEQRPTFQGGDVNSFSLWVNQRLVYPEEAKENGTQGRVTLQFTVNKEGDVCNVYVIRGVDPALDKEAYDVVLSSPKWSPGMKDGKPVSVTFTFPVIFQLR